MPRRGASEANGPIRGPFEGAAAEATESGTILLAKTTTVFNAAQVEGDRPPLRPELPGLAVRLESAERFVASTGAVIVHGGDRAYDQPAEDRIQLPPVGDVLLAIGRAYAESSCMWLDGVPGERRGSGALTQAAGGAGQYGQL